MNALVMKHKLEYRSCKDCGALRDNTSPQFSVCPNGHGKLWPYIYSHRTFARAAWMQSLPIAMKRKKRHAKRHTYIIAGHGDDVFWLGGDGDVSDVNAKMPNGEHWRAWVFRRVKEK